jgi:hypothetical protein
MGGGALAYLGQLYWVVPCLVLLTEKSFSFSWAKIRKKRVFAILLSKFEVMYFH